MDDIIRKIKSCYPHQIKLSYTTTVLAPNARKYLQQTLCADGNAYTRDACLDRVILEAKHHTTIAGPSATMHVVWGGRKTHTKHPYLVLKRIMMRVHALLTMYERKQQHITFWVVPTSNVRKFPTQDRVPVQGRNINGGFTYPDQKVVFIYRYEELPKVVLHELIHHLPIDTTNHWTQSSKMELYRLLGISSHGCPDSCSTDLNPNEAVVETWAEIMHVAFLTYEYGFPWRGALDKEVQWGLQQARKVLRKQQRMEGVWKEGTHAYSYIVLRVILLLNIQKFLATPPRNMPVMVVNVVETTFGSRAFKDAMKLPTKGDSMRMTVFGDI